MKVIVNEFIRREIILAEQREVFAYSLRETLYVLLTAGLILFAGALMDKVSLTVVFLVFFPALRKFSGGIHAQSRVGCNLATICILLSALWITVFVPTWILIVGTLCSGYYIYKYAPIEQKNHILNIRQVYISQSYSRTLTLCLTGFSTIISLYVSSQLWKMVMVTVILNGINAFLLKVSQREGDISKYRLLKLTASFILFVGMSSAVDACFVWNYQPEVSPNINRYFEKMR